MEAGTSASSRSLLPARADVASSIACRLSHSPVASPRASPRSPRGSPNTERSSSTPIRSSATCSSPASPVLADIAAEFGAVDARARRVARPCRRSVRASSATWMRSAGSTRSSTPPCVSSRLRRIRRGARRRPRRCRRLRRSAARRGAQRATPGSSSSSRTHPPEVRLRRLVELRGMSEADAAARIASQVSDDARLADRRRRHRHRRATMEDTLRQTDDAVGAAAASCIAGRAAR